MSGIQMMVMNNVAPSEAPAPFVNPTLTVGSAVSVVAQSPFVGGGNSYEFAASVDSYIDTPG